MKEKIDYTAMAKEMAAAKQVVDDYYAGKYQNWQQAEIAYFKLTGKHKAFSTLRRYTGKENGDGQQVD